MSNLAPGSAPQPPRSRPAPRMTMPRGSGNRGDEIIVVGARENNLKDISLSIPFGAITVFTGVSGSGKSSLVFDTIAAESQRQLNETFPAFLRSRMPHLGKPDVDAIENLSASVVIDQRPFGGNARSTVGTATDLMPLLRLLWSRLGQPHVGYSTVFSFNQPAGMCPRCQGLGFIDEVDPEALIDRGRSLNDGALRFPTFARGTAQWKRYVHSGLFDNDLPIAQWPTEQLRDLLFAEPRALVDPPAQWYASAKFEGLVPRFRRLYLTGATAAANTVRRRFPEEFELAVTTSTCPDCGGGRLRRDVLECRIRGLNIAQATQLPVTDLGAFLADVDAPSVGPVLQALQLGISHMVAIGLGYLSLDRVSSTLSGGEAQRVKMVRNLGSSLSRMTYILDEPSVGLHPADVDRLTALLLRLRDKGNAVLVVEHDPDVIAVADYAVDLGPGAGAAGGEVVFDGTVEAMRHAPTATGRYLRRRPRLKTDVRNPTGVLASVRDARLHNLRGVNLDVPAGVLCVLTGIAGSGKSSLLRCILDDSAGLHLIDQQGVRGTKRSMPATYLGVLDDLRRAFAAANDVGVEWFSPGSKGGCRVCRGTGVITTELAFMDDVETPCDACCGRKFNDAALSYTLHGRDIAATLDLPAHQAADLMEPILPVVAEAAARMVRCGISYLTLGQSLDTLSGGERQRLKLSRELAAPAAAYAFDEPTTGLHGRDIVQLLALFDELIDQGRSLLVIEHDLDVMAHADWIIDVGPGAGLDGGRVTFSGTPAELLEFGETPTAEHLARWVTDR